MFRREVRPSERDPEVLLDSKLSGADYVSGFGMEWEHFDGFSGKEVMSHGHLFGRFLLPRDFFTGKTVVDIGCGNGRIGRLMAPLASSYTGVDLSEAVYSFPKYTQRPPKFALLRASATDLPLDNACADVVICWGVLHHIDQPEVAFAELMRVAKPGATILLYVYPANFDGRMNLNWYLRGLSPEIAKSVIDQLSDGLDEWFEVDRFFAGLLAGDAALSFKQSKPWQKFQWFDGVTPRYHWSLEKRAPELAAQHGASIVATRPGCFVIARRA
jgi:SAM-dependent methyltransferase